MRLLPTSCEDSIYLCLRHRVLPSQVASECSSQEFQTTTQTLNCAAKWSEDEVRERARTIPTRSPKIFPSRQHHLIRLVVSHPDAQSSTTSSPPQPSTANLTSPHPPTQRRPARTRLTMYQPLSPSLPTHRTHVHSRGLHITRLPNLRSLTVRGAMAMFFLITVSWLVVMLVPDDGRRSVFGGGGARGSGGVGGMGDEMQRYLEAGFGLEGSFVHITRHHSLTLYLGPNQTLTEHLLVHSLNKIGKHQPPEHEIF